MEGGSEVRAIYLQYRSENMKRNPFAVSRMCADGRFRYYDRTDNPTEYVNFYHKHFDPDHSTKLRIKDSRTGKIVYSD